jgi:IS30 family transposase
VPQLLRGSLSRREIAAELGRSPSTIKTQTRAIYRKLGVFTRRAAITRDKTPASCPPRGRHLLRSLLVDSGLFPSSPCKAGPC